MQIWTYNTACQSLGKRATAPAKVLMQVSNRYVSRFEERYYVRCLLCCLLLPPRLYGMKSAKAQTRSSKIGSIDSGFNPIQPLDLNLLGYLFKICLQASSVQIAEIILICSTTQYIGIFLLQHSKLKEITRLCCLWREGITVVKRNSILQFLVVGQNDYLDALIIRALVERYYIDSDAI